MTSAEKTISFYAIQRFFGQLEERLDVQPICHNIPDNDRWQGVADLIVTCAVPTWSILLGAKEDIRVTLKISSTPAKYHYISKLGIQLNVFECGLYSSNLRILIKPLGVRCNAEEAVALDQGTSSSLDLCHVAAI